MKNLSDHDEFTRRYDALLKHYGLTGQKTQTGGAEFKAGRRLRLVEEIKALRALPDGRLEVGNG